MQENTFYNKALNEHQRLERDILSIQNEIRELPEGKLVCTHNGNYVKWYQSDGRNVAYISKKNRKLAEQLAIKKYLSTRLEELQQEQKAINFYLRHHVSDESGHRAFGTFEIRSSHSNAFTYLSNSVSV